MGEEFTYTIKVKNSNSKDIKVKITDVLNEKLDFVATGDGGTYGEAKIECEVNETRGNTTVTAQDPEYTYKLTYDKNTIDTVDKMPNPNPETATVAAESYEFNVSDATPTRDGYTFLGWADEPGATTPDYKHGETGKDKVTVTKDSNPKTIYAVWEEKVTLTYDANGGKPPGFGDQSRGFRGANIDYNCIIIALDSLKMAVLAHEYSKHSLISLNFHTSMGSGWGKNVVNIFSA